MIKKGSGDSAEKINQEANSEGVFDGATSNGKPRSNVVERRMTLESETANRKPTAEDDGGALKQGRFRGTRVLPLVYLALGLLAVTAVLFYMLWPSSTSTTTQSGDVMESFFATSMECFKAPKKPQDRRKNKKNLKVLNFNAEWLFLYGGRGGIKCPADSCPWTTKKVAIGHLKEVAAIIANIDADIVHLSEVEDCRVLKALLSRIKGDHGYVPYLVHGKDHQTGQNVGMLTRIDPINNMVRTERRIDYPVKGSSCSVENPGSSGLTKHYVVPMNIDDGSGKKIPFLFAGLHFLARPVDKSRCAQREAQAHVLRDLVKSMSTNDERIIMMGDYNDFDGNAVGADGGRPITKVLEFMYGSSGSRRSLLNAVALLPQSERYTAWFDRNQNCRVDENEKVMLDHVLYDDSLHVANVTIHHDYMPTCEKRISDHWPVSVEFVLS